MESGRATGSVMITSILSTAMAGTTEEWGEWEGWEEWEDTIWAESLGIDMLLPF